MSVARVLAALALAASFSTFAQQKEIKIGFIYDVTGPFAGGGSEPAQIGTKAAVDYFNERGGVAGYKINAIFVDAQSKVDVAINEMTRLIDRSEEHTSELQSLRHLVCRLLLEKKKTNKYTNKK